MQCLERIADAAFEILKEKFQYISDQLELNSKQHQAVKGQFVSYLQKHVVIGFNSSCYDIHWRKRTCWNTYFLFGFVKPGYTFWGEWFAEEQNKLASCHLWICFAVIVGFARSSNDVQVKRTWIFAYRIKTRFAFPPSGQLHVVEAMVWPVWIKVSLMQHLNFEMFCTFV